ncbi:SPOR domain-containing protein [Burkholderia guangdongensis]|uniref:SPOR domain-containing protein n=1 Tax=Burkholderia guangdongensis TaxID=1792500 RepID=UPI0015CB3257|nr:SPOR domain-containing protein [Burkholderia guangdongensis]
MAQPRRKPQQSKQAGGTFIGVVLGLIVGLAIAVVVALYITRSPSPFVAKVAPPADNGASQPQQIDPNRVLQGKTPGQPVPQTAQTPPNTAPGQGATSGSGMLPAPQIVEMPPSGNNAAPSSSNDSENGNGNDSVVPPQPADVTPPKKKSSQAVASSNDIETETARQPQPRPQAPAKAAQTPSQAQAAAPKSPSPAAILANNMPQKAPSAPSASDTNTGYFLQVGAYKTETDAEQQRARLGFQGFESKVSKRDVSGVTYFRVRVGPFSKFEDMNSARQRLSDAGVDTAVIRFTKQ